MELKRYWTRRKWTALVAIVLGAVSLVAGCHPSRGSGPLGRLAVLHVDDAHIRFACECRVVNVGSGPAILPSGEVTMPNCASYAEGDAWLLQGIRTSFPGLPQVLQVGAQASGTVKIDTTSYEIPEGRTPEFASIELKFQDAERNLFQQTYTFNVFRHGAHYYLSVAYERLKMTALRKRWIGDEDVGRALVPDPAETIYERAGIL